MQELVKLSTSDPSEASLKSSHELRVVTKYRNQRRCQQLFKVIIAKIFLIDGRY